jgi:predicted metal-binding membrane protein
VNRLGQIGALLVLLIGGAWAYLITMHWGMRHMDMGVDMWIMPRMMDWDATDIALVLLMWALMMAAMMLPSVLPVVLFVVRFNGAARAVGFIAGYLLPWGAFSVSATLVQWTLLKATLLSRMMKSTSIALGAAVLVVAGLYQFTSLKQRCLAGCRSPWVAVLNPTGPTAAIRAGLEHGAYCVGCCGVLMALLFVAGVMNLLWIVVIVAYVIVEKWAPRPAWSSRAAGAVLCIAAVTLLAVAKF